MIGPGGKIIQQMQEDTGATITIDEVDGVGKVQVSAPDKEAIEKKKEEIAKLEENSDAVEVTSKVNGIISAVNITSPKQFEVKTPSVVIKINSDRTDLVETRMIDGHSYILIRADEGVEVNGVNVNV